MSEAPRTPSPRGLCPYAGRAYIACAYTEKQGGGQLVHFHDLVGSFDQESYYNSCHQKSDFTAKMHQIVGRLGLCPRPSWGSLQQSCCPRGLANWPRGSSRTPHEGLGLGLGLGLERKVLALALGRSRPRLFNDPGHVVDAQTHSVTYDSAVSCLGKFHRFACKLDIGCKKIIRVCEVRAAV